MIEQITCPKCRTAIKLTEILKSNLIAKIRKDFDRQLSQRSAEFSKRELQLKKSQQAIGKTEMKKARLALAEDLKHRDQMLAELQQALDAKNAKLAESQKTHTEVIRKARQLDDAKREMDLTIEKRVQDSIASVRTQAKTEAEQAMKALVLRKETQLVGMQRQIEELRRKSQQGSQQLQGEALERELEALLRARFPQDQIDAIRAGEVGADLLQHVISSSGQRCGKIIWEAKSTKLWTDSWLAKLRHDQRTAKAEVALIVSEALPKGVDTFDLVDGVWVTTLRSAIPLSIALRQSLIDLSASHRAAQGQKTKAELVYQYLTGPGFRHRIEAIVEKFTDMQIDLDQERKAMNRAWAKREQQLASVLDASAGLFGDIQGIAGRVMVDTKCLEFSAVSPKLTSTAPTQRAETRAVRRAAPKILGRSS